MVLNPTVVKWLLALSGLSNLFCWGAICLCHIRFRRAWKVQGHSLDELPYQALGGIYGSWFGVVLVVLVLIGQFYVAIWPVGYEPGRSGTKIAQDFFGKLLAYLIIGSLLMFLKFSGAYLAVPVMIGFYITGYIWKRSLPQRSHEIDLDSGRKAWYTAEEMNEWRAQRRAAPIHIRIFRAFFTH